MSRAVARVDRCAVAAYLLLAHGLMWLACLPLWVSGQGLRTPGALAIITAAMWTPALASYLVCRFVERAPWRARVGLRSVAPRRTVARIAVTGFLLVTAAMVAATALGGITGLSRLDVIGLSGSSRLLDGLPSGTTVPPPVVVVVVGVIGTVTASFTVNAAVALGEEVGWRGYLVPALLPLGRGRAMVLSGIAWALWHAPIVLLGYDYEGSGRAVALLALTASAIAFGTLLAWLRVRSDSVLPAAVAHGAFNGWMRMFPLFVAAGAPLPLLTASPMGLTGCLVLGALAVWLLGRGLWTPAEPAVAVSTGVLSSSASSTSPRASTAER